MAVFYSFHYQRDAWRVQGIIQSGVLERQRILNSQKWEEVQRQGDRAIEDWIDSQMKWKEAVVVLVGAETAKRRWVRYEIKKAWEDGRALVGIRIHGLADAAKKTDPSGPNPFERVSLPGGGTVADHVTLHNPVGATSQAVFATITANLKTWVRGAYRPS